MKKTFAALICLLLMSGCVGAPSQVAPSSQSAEVSQPTSIPASSQASSDSSQTASAALTDAELAAQYANLTNSVCVRVFYRVSDGQTLCGLLPGGELPASQTEIDNLKTREIAPYKLKTVLSAAKKLKEIYVMPADGIADAQAELDIRMQLDSIGGISVILSTAIGADKLVSHTVELSTATTTDWSEYSFSDDESVNVNISLPADWKRDSIYSPTFTNLQSDIKIVEMICVLNLAQGQGMFTDAQGSPVELTECDGKGTFTDAQGRVCGYRTDTVYSPGGEKEIDVWYFTTVYIPVDKSVVCLSFFTLTPHSENADGMALYREITNTVTVTD